jgi:HAD superfamily hydrolase (TIGR01509 family)
MSERSVFEQSASEQSVSEPAAWADEGTGKGRLTLPPPLVIFDCDGVLVDSEPLAARVNVELLTELGWPISQAEVEERFIGCSYAYFRSEVEAHLGRPIPADWDPRFKERFETLAEHELVAVDGVGGVLAALVAAEVPICVASNSRRERVAWSLEHTGLGRYFAGHLFSGRDVAAPKPAPDVFLHAAATMGIEPSTAVVVEDSRPGIQAARAAGMVVFGYAGGLSRADVLAEAGAIVFTDMAELPGLLAVAAAAQ